LDGLEPALRSVLVLRYFAELDSKEIGNILGLPDSTVRSRLRAARRKLAWELKRAGYRDD
jgi:RNA polymerase sigma factor (sigma-70 family)